MPSTGISLNNIKDRAIELLREVPGASVQTYGEPRLQALAQSIFNKVFKEHFWPDLCDWVTVTLDGSTGQPTTNPGAIDFTDIAAVYPEGSNVPLPIFGRQTNPDTVTGSQPRFIQPLRQSGSGNLKLFKVLPIAATGNVTLYQRYSPGDLTSTPDAASIFLDKEMLALGCVYVSLEQDGSNPAATELYLNEFNSRMTNLIGSYGEIGIVMGDYGAQIPTQWSSN